MRRSHHTRDEMRPSATGSTDPAFDAVTATLSVHAQRILSELGVTDADALLRLTHDELVGAWSCGKKTVAEIEHLQTRLSTEQESPDPHDSASNTFPFKDAPRQVFDAVKASLSVRALHTLEDLEITDVLGLMFVDESQLLKCRNCGRKTVKEILAIQNGLAAHAKELVKKPDGFSPQDLIAAPCLTGSGGHLSLEKGFLADMEHPAQWLLEWVRSLARSHRQERAFLLRKGMAGLPAMTLDLVGEQVGGVTRERARQMEKGIEKRANAPQQQARLRPLMAALARAVKGRGGLATLKELTKDVLCKGPAGEQLKFARELLTFFATLPAWDEAGLRLDKKGVVSHKDSRMRVRRLTDVLEKIAEHAADERHGDGLWSVERDRLKRSLLKALDPNTDGSSPAAVSDALLDAALNSCKQRVRAHENRIYSIELWRLQFGNVVQTVETLLRQAGSPVHFAALAEQVSKWRPNVSPNNTRATLDRCRNALLWDLGTFVHQDNVVVPLSLIHDAEVWLIDALGEDVPFVSAHGVFVHFESRCRSAGIPSEVALYTCLRRSDHPDLAYPRVPSVYLKRGFKERMPMMLALEDFIRDAGGPVSQDELKAFGMGKVFLKDFQYTQFSLKLSNVIRTADWGYLHLDNLEIDMDCLEAMVAHTQQVLAAEGHCSIDKVYRDKRVSCRAAGIDGPVMLYSLLQCFADERLDLPSYPRVAARSIDEIAQRHTIGERIVAFVREHGGPCPYEILEEKLVAGLGYKEQQIYSVDGRYGTGLWIVKGDMWVIGFPGNMVRVFGACSGGLRLAAA